jgi:hypothetical protein
LVVGLAAGLFGLIVGLAGGLFGAAVGIAVTFVALVLPVLVVVGLIVGLTKLATAT